MRSLLAVAFLLALALGMGAQNTSSVPELETAVRLSPHSAEAWYKLGIAKFRQTDAKLAFEKAIELKPDYSQAYVALGAWHLSKRRCVFGSTLDLGKLRAEREGKAARVIVLLNQAIELNSLDPIAFIYLAKAYELLEKADKGAEAFEKAIELGTKESWVFVSLARLYRNLGRKEDALKSYRYVTGKVQLSEDSTAGEADSYSLEAIWKKFAYRELAALYVELGQYDEALATYREIVSSAASDVGIRYQLGLLFLKLRDKRSAEQEYLAMKRIAMGTNHKFSRKLIRKDAKELLDKIKKSES